MLTLSSAAEIFVLGEKDFLCYLDAIKLHVIVEDARRGGVNRINTGRARNAVPVEFEMQAKLA
jgi:hypothetical protein